MKTSIPVKVTCPISGKEETCYFLLNISIPFSNGCDNCNGSSICEKCKLDVSYKVVNNIEHYLGPGPL